MHGLWLENGKLQWRQDLPLPEPSRDQALVKIHLAGICGTDLQLLQGYLPFAGIPGHEFCGEIVAAPDDPSRVGQRVVGEINLGCGECRLCRAGLGRHCRRREVVGIRGRGGAFAEYLVLPLKNLHPVPDNVPDEAAVFCEPLAAALEIREQAAISGEDSVLVIGAGRLGQLVARVVALSGCRLDVVARYPAQRILLANQGLSWMDEARVVEDDYDKAVEATGSPSGFELALRALRPRGVLLLKSTYKSDFSFNPSRLVVDEITLTGSRCGPFPPALRLMEMGLCDPRDLISECLPLEQGIRAFELAGQKGMLKVIVRIA